MRKSVILTILVLVAAVAVLAYLQSNKSAKADPRHPVPGRPKAAARIKPDARVQAKIRPHIETAPAPAAPPETKPSAAPASVSGTVADENGAPVPNARVELRIYAKDHKNVPLATYTAQTAADGRYDLPGIATFGPAEIKATARGYVGVESGHSRSLPGSPSLPAVAEGESHENIDFKLPLAAAAITGRVIDQARMPVPGAYIEVAKQPGDRSSQGWFGETSDAKGHFELPLPGPSECVLLVRKQGYATTRFANIRPGRGDLELMIRSGGTIAGRVTGPASQPLQGVQILVLGEKEPGAIGNPWQSTGSFQTQTDANGEYEVSDLSEEFTYTVRAPFPQREEISVPKTIRSLPSFLLRMEETVRDLDDLQFGTYPQVVLAEKSGVGVRAGRVTRVDLVTQYAALLPSAIYGTVTEPDTGKPVPAVLVYALCDALGRKFSLAGMAVTQTDGSYRIPIQGILQPVSIQVRAGFCFTNNSFKEKYEVATVQLGPGKETRVDFTMPASVTVPVRVVSPDGTPMPGLDITLNGAPLGFTSDDEGRVTLYGIDPYVPYVVGAMRSEPNKSNHVSLGQSAPFTGQPGETLPEIQVVCGATGQITGRVDVPGGLAQFAHPSLGYRVTYKAGTMPTSGISSLDPDGRFLIPEAGEGTCTVRLRALTNDPDLSYWADVDGVEVRAGTVVDLGLIPIQPPPAPEFK
jgi:hypothetical protein